MTQGLVLRLLPPSPESADQSDALHALREIQCALDWRVSVWSARVFSAAFALPWIMNGWPALALRAHWDHEPPRGFSAAKD